MIFATVGTHEQPFNRLVECLDNLKKNGTIKEKIIIQTGYSTYKLQYCEGKDFFSYQEMINLVAEARIVITHGGPSSFIMPLQFGKIPIVVPRKYEFNEHVNDHQVLFTKTVAERMENIIVVENIIELGITILNYDAIVRKLRNKLQSNNAKFNREFENIVNTMFEVK